MPSTYTLNNGIELIGTGEQSGTWGDTTNTNFDLVDTALDGQVSILLSGAGSSGSPNDLPISDGTSSNGRNRMITFTDGTDLGATAFVQLTPNDSEKIIYVRNNLRGSRSIILFQGTYNASNDYEVPAGTTAVVYFDGAGTGAVAANVFNNAYFDSLRLGGVSVTNILDEDNMASNSATALSTQQSIKAYVDAQVGSFDTLAEVLAQGNTTGGTDLAVSTGDDITFADSSKAIFGAGNDLQISHDGNNSIIDEVGTGNLYLRSSHLYMQNVDSDPDEMMISAIANGAVTLSHNGSPKIATTATGIDVTGSVTMDGGSSSGQFTVDALLKVGTASGTEGGEIQFVDSSGSFSWFVDVNATDAFRIRSSTANNAFNIAASGNVAMSHRLNVAGALNVTGALGVSDAINYNGASNFYVRSRLNGGIMALGTETTAGDLYYPIVIHGTNEYTQFNTPTSEAMRITPDGYLALGTTNVTGTLATYAHAMVIGDSDTGFGQNADGALDTFANNQKVMSVTNNAISLNKNTTVDGIINTINGTDINMDAAASGQLKLDGNGYAGAIALNAQGMNIYTNSASRDLIFGTNEIARMRIDGTGVISATNLIKTTNNGFEVSSDSSAHYWMRNAAGDARALMYRNAAANELTLQAYRNSDNAVRAILNIDPENENFTFITGTANRLTVNSTGLNVTGRVDSTGYVVEGVGAGGVGLTHNDGYGNASVTFNHVSGTPEQNGASARITFNTDTASANAAQMDFQIKSSVTSGTAVTAVSKLVIAETKVTVADALQVNGDIDVISASATPLHVDRNVSSGAATIQVSNSTHTTYFGTRSGGGFAIDDDADLSSGPWFVIDTAGQVGIGTTAPQAVLHVADAGAASDDFTAMISAFRPSLTFQDTSSGTNNDWEILVDGGDMAFLYGDATTGTKLANEAMRIDDSGNVGIGTSSPLSNLHIEDLGNTVSQRIFTSDNVSNAKASLLFGTTPGARTKAAVEMVNSSTGNAAGTLSFSTNDGTTLTERMRIKSTGDMLMGSTAATANAGKLQISGKNGHHCATFRNGNNGGYGLVFRNTSNSVVGSVTWSASATAYNTSSDYRLKEAWVPMTGASERVQALKPINFAWKVDGSRVDGFLAHEAQDVVPECATGTKDAMMDEEYEVTPAVLDDDGNETSPAVMGTRSVPDYQGIDQSKIVPLLTAALQEALTKIDALETRLTALEAV